MSPMFRKKPVVIAAVQWTGDRKAIREFMDIEESPRDPPLAHQIRRPYYDFGRNDDRISIATLEGIMHASPGDWIIQGVKGEFYPCKPDIFEATYEPVDDPTA